jgi:hypothetical protein
MRVRSDRRLFLALLAAAVLVAASGCIKLSDLSESERLFPDSALRGAVARATLRDLIEGKRGKGREITANAFLDESPTVAQLKPTALTILKRLKEKYTDAVRIDVAIYDDERAYQLGLTVAKARYETGKVTIVGGLPTEEEVAAINSKRGKDDKLGPFAAPREEDYNIANKVNEISAAVPPPDAPLVMATTAEANEAAIERKAAAFFKIPPERVRTARFNLSNWYGMHRERKILESK